MSNNLKIKHYMLLSEKLKQLQQDIFNDEHSPSDIEDGWNRCIEDAKFMENKLNKYKKKQETIAKALENYQKLKKVG